jgi:hypothetical protein
MIGLKDSMVAQSLWNVEFKKKKKKNVYER